MMETNNSVDWNNFNGNRLVTPPKPKESVLARTISIVLSPLLVVVYAVVLALFYPQIFSITTNQLLRIVIPVLFLSCIIPATGVYFLKTFRIINNYESEEEDGRFFQTLLFLVSYSLLFYYFINFYTWFLALLIVPVILTIVQYIVTLFWKMSTYMLAMGGLLGSFLSVCYNVKGINPYIFFAILFILAGSLGVSRLILKRSTPLQVYVGFLVGFVISYTCVCIGSSSYFHTLFR